MSLLTPKIVFHDTAGGGWYCNQCKQYINPDMIYSHTCSAIKPIKEEDKDNV